MNTKKLFLTMFATAALATSGSVSATTYNYMGAPFTIFSGGCNSFTCGGALSGFVTFDFDTSSFSGTLSLSAGDTAGLNSPLRSPLGNNLTFPASIRWFDPPQNTYGYIRSLSGIFTLVDGSITSWSLGGYTSQIGCGGGPGCASGSSNTSTTPTADHSAWLDYSYPTYFNDASNAGGGAWSQAVPEPETYAMMLASLGLLGFVARRRRQKAV